jgi:hypothetical protein
MGNMKGWGGMKERLIYNVSIIITNLSMASGTWPANPGKTGIIPKALILSKILCCSIFWRCGIFI